MISLAIVKLLDGFEIFFVSFLFRLFIEFLIGLGNGATPESSNAGIFIISEE